MGLLTTRRAMNGLLPLAAICAALHGCAPAGEPQPKPAQGQPGAGGDPKPADAKPADSKPAAVEFPPYVKKKLFASTDLRGKPAPKLEVAEWIKPESAPETKDKVVLVDFWATWCGPCRALSPELEEWQKTFKDDLVVIGISDEKEATVKAYVDAKKIGYTMAVDPKAKMKNALGVQGIPHVMIYGSDGVVRWQGFPQAGEDRLSAAVIKQIIDADKARRAAPPKPAQPKA